MEDLDMILPVNTYNWLDNALSTLFNGQLSSACGHPAMNIKEDEKEYVVELAVPGLSKEDLDVRIDQDSNLMVKVEKKRPVSNEKNVQDKKDEEHYIRRDFTPVNFERKFLLSDDIERELIAAKIDNGVLTLLLPKKVEARSRREIEVA